MLYWRGQIQQDVKPASTGFFWSAPASVQEKKGPAPTVFFSAKFGLRPIFIRLCRTYCSSTVKGVFCCQFLMNPIERKPKMKKILFIGPLSALVLMLLLGSAYAQYYNPDYSPPPRSGWYCPYCGSYQGGYGMGPGMMGGRGYGYGMGPGMMGGRGYGYGMGPGMMGPGYGYGMGPGMMGRGYGYGMGPGRRGGRGYGYGMGPGMMGPGYGYGPNEPYPYAQQEPQKPLDKNQAKAMVENYLKSTGNPNLKLGDIKDDGQYFEADIVTKDNSLVDKLLVDKDTGSMRSAY
jgi:hypothetical protein